ncbi:MAG TPA: hypothetical protein VLT16_16055 [Candidatus Limnocylindrales bacterium]|nr:hypothetical protein [Candidatus Limnocylindrales bacterium]
MRSILLSGFLTAALAGCVLLSGCTITTHERGNANGESKNAGEKDVDIRTPLGSLSIRKGASDPKETGLSLYPGAQLKKSTDTDDSSANVNISSSLFGMKLVVLKYQTADPPEKVLGFYRKEMAHYGNVVNCKGGFTMNFHRHDRDSEVSCEGHNGSDHDYKEELKVGTENNQRIVAVKPSGNGSEFVMLYVRARDEKDTM